jgi:hypothetical protein
MNQEFATIRNAVLAYAVAQAGACSGSSSPSVNIPTWSQLTSGSQPVLPATFPLNDPWGRAWSAGTPTPYYQNRSTVDRIDTGPAVTLTSGPSGTTANIIYASDIQGALASWYATCTAMYCAAHPSSCTAG